MSNNYVNFLKTNIKSINKTILNRDITVTKLCNNALEKIQQSSNKSNPFITTLTNQSIENAAKLDYHLQKHDPNKGTLSTCHQHPLFGIPISIKDNFCTKDILTTCGSKMLYNYFPPYNAKAVEKLLQANCLIMGKTNMDEFAMGSSSTTSYFGPSANSWKNMLSLSDKPNLENSQDWFIAGGSSTGSAISVANGSCFASLATDTGGSARQPASLTGVVGFKPSYGLISRLGLIPLAHCLDVVSIIARNVDDIRLIFETIVGQDENDLTTVNYHEVLKSNIDENKKTIRIGVPDEFIAKSDMSNDISSQLDKILKILQSNNLFTPDDKINNIEVIKLNLLNSSLATECYTIISSAEIASNMSCYDGIKYGYSSQINQSSEFNRDEFYRRNRDESLGSEVKKRILLGNYFLMEENREKYFVQALKLRRLISDEFDRAFDTKQLDVIIMPATPTTSVSYKEWLKKQNTNRLFHEDYFLIPSNLANLPSISLPAGLSQDELPIGIQLIGNRYHDTDLLTISKFLEEKLFTNVF